MNFGEFLDKMEGFRSDFQDFPLSFVNMETVDPSKGDSFEIMGFYPEDGDINAPVENLRIAIVESEEIVFGVDELDDLIGFLTDLKVEIEEDGKKDHVKSFNLRVGDDGDYLKVSKVCNVEGITKRRKKVDII